jgi:hypothetical protein
VCTCMPEDAAASIKPLRSHRFSTITGSAHIRCDTTQCGVVPMEFAVRMMPRLGGCSPTMTTAICHCTHVRVSETATTSPMRTARCVTCTEDSKLATCKLHSDTLTNTAGGTPLTSSLDESSGLVVENMRTERAVAECTLASASSTSHASCSMRIARAPSFTTCKCKPRHSHPAQPAWALQSSRLCSVPVAASLHCSRELAPLVVLYAQALLK